MMETRFLRLHQIIGNPKANPPIPPLIPIKKSSLWAWVKAKNFPPPIKIGKRVTVWRSEDVEHWMREQIERNQGGGVMTRDELINQQVTQAGHLYKAIMLKAYEGTASPRSAIKAQCLICVGYKRDDVTHCTGFTCPLWAYRPYQNRGGRK